jgi:hypothetical protein
MERSEIRDSLFNTAVRAGAVPDEMEPQTLANLSAVIPAKAGFQ